MEKPNKFYSNMKEKAFDIRNMYYIKFSRSMATQF